MKSLLKSYLKRLTNLSGNNKALLQTRLVKSQDVDFLDFDFMYKDQSSFQLLAKLLQQNGAVRVCAVLDPRDHKSNELSTQLSKIYRKNELIFQERGVRDLYLGWPLVQGKFTDGTLVRCPLFLIPMDLQEKNGHWQLQSKTEESLVWNKSFLLAYSHFNKISFTEEFLENIPSFDSKDFLNYRRELYEFLKNSPLEINFNRELFEERIQSFLPNSRKELEEIERNGELKLFPQAILGIYPQSGSYLMPDYEEMISHVGEDQKFESFFEQKFLTLESNSILKSEHTYTPLSIDGSQEKALKAVKEGKSVVVQGPPGTGKSQLIANLVADYTSRGKKVLVVCQKKVALEVVKNRLNDIGAKEFSVLLHDFQHDRKAIFNQIKSQIEQVSDYENTNNQLDSIYLERDFLKSSREIDVLSEELETFKNALFDEQICGWSIKEMYLTSKLSEEKYSIDFQWFDKRNLDEFLDKLELIFPYIQRLETEEFEWKRRKSFQHLNSGDLPKILCLFSEYFKSKKQLEQIEIQLFGEITIEEKRQAIIQELAENKEHIHSQYLKEKTSTFKKAFTSKFSIQNLKKYVSQLDKIAKEGFWKNSEEQHLKRLTSDIQTQLQKNNFGFSFFISKLFDSKLRKLSQKLKNEGFDWNKTNLEEACKQLNNSILLQEIQENWQSFSFLDRIPTNETLKEFVISCQEFLGLFQVLKTLDLGNSFWNNKALETNSFTSYLEPWQKSLSLKNSQSIELEEYFDAECIEEGSEEVFEKSKTSLISEFENLCAYDKMKSKFTGEELKLLNQLIDNKHINSFTETRNHIKNYIFTQWIYHIESKYPILREVSSLDMLSRENKLLQAIQSKQKGSIDIVNQRLREGTYKNLAHNRLGNRTTYRELLHQVSKQKRIWPVRQLMAEFSNEILDLIPCWLASPEAVSAVFPLQFKFDLVIFDEASQCFSERGIPAIYRAKQVVITGDSQQLSPYDLYQVRFEDEQEENDSLLEIDSLLEVCKQFLPEHHLQGHYRSRSLDLIGFSNEHFYKGKLKMIPHLNDYQELHSGFEYYNVYGRWQNNSNQIEAEKVAERCWELFETEPTTSLGVVCFNYKQQQLIQDLVWKKSLEKEKLIPTHFFVKNIENVQGDERDIIIFSLAYAPNNQGNILMNFGSLNQEGGDKRLNVAVTRARFKNILYTSLWPQELNVENAKNAGPKLLKSFLEYAHQSASKEKIQQTGNEATSKIDWWLKNKIKAKDKNLHSVYFADLQSKEQLILTDDDQYFASNSGLEAHIYHPQQLTQKGWTWERSWSRESWKGG